MLTVTASYANKNFVSLLRAIARGESIQIVSCGAPLATLVPAGVRTKVQPVKENTANRQANKTGTNRRDSTD